MPSSNLSFRSPEDFLDKIRQRDLSGVKNPGATAKRDLSRFYDLLNEGIAQVRIQPVEAVVLIHYVNTYEGYATPSQILGAGEVIFDNHLGLDDYFDEARTYLAGRHASWTPAARYAAWDAAERYQVLVTPGEAREGASLTFGMALHRVSLHNYSVEPDELAHIESMGALPADRLAEEYLKTLPEE